MWLVPLSFLGFLLIVPDEAGGGWTHTWRAEAFPYLGLALACATLPFARILRRLAVLVAAIGGLVMIGMAFWVQTWEVPQAVREFNEADALIGPHCTVAPVLTQFKLDPENTARLFYHPLFHLANRFELRADRPVLFSYVARLPVYLVQVRPEADPQRFLYRWQPSQRDTRVRQDRHRRAFERPVEFPSTTSCYGDFPALDQPGPYQDIRSAVTRGHYELVHRSSGGRMELYRRTAARGLREIPTWVDRCPLRHQNNRKGIIPHGNSRARATSHRPNHEPGGDHSTTGRRLAVNSASVRLFLVSRRDRVSTSRDPEADKACQRSRPRKPSARRSFCPGVGANNCDGSDVAPD